MILQIDVTKALPPFEQIRGQIAWLIESGELSEGTRLPTIRQLSGDLGLAPGTVARAYRELEQAGLVISRVRHGTVVAPRPAPSTRETADRLAIAARSYVQAVRALGLGGDEGVAAVQRELAQESAPTVKEGDRVTPRKRRPARLGG